MGGKFIGAELWAGRGDGRLELDSHGGGGTAGGGGHRAEDETPSGRGAGEGASGGANTESKRRGKGVKGLISHRDCLVNDIICHSS